MSLYKYIDWDGAVMQLLRDIELEKCALNSIATRIISLEHTMALEIDGKYTVECELDMMIERRKALEKEIESFNMAWNSLSEDEQIVLTELFLKRPSTEMKAVYNVEEKLHCAQATVYKLKKRALNNFLIAFTGGAK